MRVSDGLHSKIDTVIGNARSTSKGTTPRWVCVIPGAIKDVTATTTTTTTTLRPTADSGTREPAKPVVPPVYTSASHLMKCAPKLLSGSSSSVSRLGEVNCG